MIHPHPTTREWWGICGIQVPHPSILQVSHGASAFLFKYSLPGSVRCLPSKIRLPRHAYSESVLVSERRDLFIYLESPPTSCFLADSV